VLQGLTTSQGLFLQFNNIERLPPQLFSISALSVLVLDSNCLTRIPDDVGRLQQLTVTRDAWREMCDA